MLWESSAPFAQVRRFEPHRKGYELNEIHNTQKAERVTGAVFSPDGRRVLTASDDTVTVWEAATGQPLRHLDHPPLVNAVAVSSDGRYAVSGGSDHLARVWDLGSGGELRRLEGHGSGINAVAFSPDGRLLLTASEDRTARIWEMGSGRELRRLDGHGGGVRAVAFSPDGRLALTASADQTARLWEVASGAELCRLVAFRDGTWAVVDKEGRFDASNGGELTVPLAGHPYLIPGKENLVEVRAFNAEGYLSSRGVVVTYTPEGEAPSAPPQLWAVVAGISDYNGEHIDLRFAAKDAQDWGQDAGCEAEPQRREDECVNIPAFHSSTSGCSEPTCN